MDVEEEHLVESPDLAIALGDLVAGVEFVVPNIHQLLHVVLQLELVVHSVVLVELEQPDVLTLDPVLSTEGFHDVPDGIGGVYHEGQLAVGVLGPDQVQLHLEGLRDRQGKDGEVLEGNPLLAALGAHHRGLELAGERLGDE